MRLTTEQVIEMAPDPASAAAGKKLMALKNWEDLGQSAGALWGKCRGSALYQVKVDLSNMGYHCSCPSRKFPCKHSLGLMLVAAASPDAVPEGAVPDWVEEWLSKRRDKAEKKAEKEEAAARKPVDEVAQQKRAEQREGRVAGGLARLDLWIQDLVRTGLAGVESRPADFWDEQAKRLVDAQAPGLASRVARLAAIPRSSRDWPQRLLAELGRVKLLVHAYGRLRELEPALQSEVRQAIGWTVSQAELEEQGEATLDQWVVAGQWIDDEERLRAERSWLVGRRTGRWALVLQFAPSGQPFAESIVAGTEQEGKLVFYPGTVRRRARLAERSGEVAAATERLPGFGTIDEFFAATSDELARQPWSLARGTVLRDVTLVPRSDEPWLVRDRDGHGLPLRGRDHWKMLAVSGGAAFDLAAEWDGDRLRPLGMVFEGQYRGP